MYLLTFLRWITLGLIYVSIKKHGMLQKIPPERKGNVSKLTTTWFNNTFYKKSNLGTLNAKE